MRDQNAQAICVNDIDIAAIQGSLKAAVKAEGVCAMSFIPLPGKWETLRQVSSPAVATSLPILVSEARKNN